jgi:hypothetical protein
MTADSPIAFGPCMKLARDHGYDGPSDSVPAAQTFAAYLASPEAMNDAPAHGNPFSTRAEDKDRPPPQWLVEGLIQENTDVLIAAPSKKLKTFVGIELNSCIATGKPVFGTLRVNRKGRGFFGASEGAHSLQAQRLTAWEIAHGEGPYTAEGVHVAPTVPMLNTDNIAGLIEGARAYLKPGERAGLFVIDTLNRALNGADEDKSSTASAYFNNITTPIRKALGCSTVTIHHMGKDATKGARGSSAFYAGFDTVIFIDKAEKDAGTGTVFYLQARTVATPNGPSLALFPAAQDDLKRAAGRQVGLRRTDVAAALAAMGAAPGGANEWNGKTGGIPTRPLATEIARARAEADGAGVEPTQRDLDVLVATLNREARAGGPFDAYVVREKPRQWAVAPGPVSMGAHHE